MLCFKSFNKVYNITKNNFKFLCAFVPPTFFITFFFQSKIFEHLTSWNQRRSKSHRLNADWDNTSIKESGKTSLEWKVSTLFMVHLLQFQFLSLFFMDPINHFHFYGLHEEFSHLIYDDRSCKWDEWSWNSFVAAVCALNMSGVKSKRTKKRKTSRA